MYNNALELIKWWADRLTFSAILYLVGLGGHQVYDWWLTTQPIQIDITQLSADERAELSKQIFLAGQEEQETRKHR